MEERNAKVYSDEQLASELKNKRAAGGGAKALSIAGVILVVAGLMTTLISVAIFGVILCLIGALVMNWCGGYWKACLKRWIISRRDIFPEVSWMRQCCR